MNPAALIFDCDGTLADSMPAHFSAWSETAARYGLVFPEARFYALAGMSTRSIFELLASEAGLTLDLDEATRVRDEAFLRRAHEVRPFAPVIEIARAHRGDPSGPRASREGRTFTVRGS